MNNTSLLWPYQPSVQMVYMLSDFTLQQIREMVKEEIEKALAEPENERPSAMVEYVHDGKRWRGTVYLIEDESEEE